MASGTGGQIALTRTGSLYASATEVVSASFSPVDWRWTNFVSESIEHNLEELEEGAITGRRAAPDSHKGNDFGEGDIELEPNPNALGVFLRAVLGTVSSSLVTEAGSTGANSGDEAGKPTVHHVFTARDDSYDERSHGEPHGVMVYKDTGSAWIFNGSNIWGMDLSFQAGALLTATANIMAREVALLARPSALQSLVSSGGRPWVWDTVSVQIGDSANSLEAITAFEGLSVRYEESIEGVQQLDGNKLFGEFQATDFQRVTVDGTLSFRNQDEYQKFRAYENRFLRITATNVNSKILLGNPDSADYYTLTVEIPQFKYTSFSVPISGPNRLQANISGKGEYDTTSGYQIEVRLTNVTSTY